MGRIHLLDKAVAELIAAGEVVERPASVVKELVENALDAGADSITVEIQRGGVSYIRVADNGSGMLREDVPIAFLRHATSKVATAADLEGIGTLGFRGEALASIAAVARVELLTRTPQEISGTRYRIQGGEGGEPEEAGCPQGTTILVRDLFYNTPARMKFLKKDVTEANLVENTVEKLALSHPEVSIRFIRDGDLKLLTPGNGDLRSTAFEVFGREFADNLIPVDYQSEGIAVSGLITRPRSVRANRTMQNFFVNSRYVKNRLFTAALEEGYKNSIMVGKFPGCVLHLTIAPQVVDVNVSPSKTELRMENEKRVFDAIYYGVKNALKLHDPSEVALFREKSVSKDADSRTVDQLFRQTAGQEKPVQESFHSYLRQGGQRLEDPYRAPMSPAGGGSCETKGPFQNTEQEKGVARSAELQGSRQEKLTLAELQGLDKLYAAIPATGYAGSSPRREEPQGFHSGLSPYQTSSAFTSPAPGFEREAPTPTASWPDTSPVPEKVREDSVPAHPADGEPTGTPPLAWEEDRGGAQENEAGKADKRGERRDREAASPCAAGETTAYRMLGELFGTYILLEMGDALLLVDKHAAHERILFEQFRTQQAGQDRQLLLAPVAVTLSRTDYDALSSHMDVVEQLGFLVEDFGSCTVLVREAPMWIEDQDVQSCILEIADNLSRQKKDSSPEYLDWLFHSMACRAAVKAQDRNTPVELDRLVHLLMEEDIRYCPHGRPVAVSLTKGKIEKMFGRIQ